MRNNILLFYNDVITYPCTYNLVFSITRGAAQNDNKFVNLGALKFSVLNKINIFQFKYIHI